jgi:transketolase
MRKAFFEELVNAAEINKKIVLIVGDLGYGAIEMFANRFPDRFFNAGVAEQNMIGLASGIASEGFHVFVYSIGNFSTFRCAEQIRNDVDYHNLPVTVVAAGGGLAYGNLGYSHHAIQDYALIRTMPNMLIAAPGDPMEVRACVRYLINNPQPSYLRLGKVGEVNIHHEVPNVSPGSWLAIRERDESKEAFLTTGAVLATVMDFIQKKHHSVYSMPLWGMRYKEQQGNYFSKFDLVTTVEDHLIDAGFGSWLMESLSTNSKLLENIRIRGLRPEVCGLVGSQKELNHVGGLSEEDVCK